MMEEWRPIEETNGYYEGSNHGRIRRSKPGFSTWVGKILNPRSDKDGYCTVHFSFNGTRLERKVHRLIAELFLGPCPDGMTVNHKDLNKRNNRLRNLEYATRAANIRHAMQNGVSFAPINPLRGEENGNSKLSESDVRKIRYWYAMGIPSSEIGRKIGLHHSTVLDIAKHKMWRHVT